ncbi:VOC family protein [Nocardia farcinica]|uniref:VOC domain-containing protein n=2 Tax=Nocardia farcinica TaxID=37329 RepID=Q5YPE8_NOCFA|nr:MULTISPECIES: VOC family protein [Nocardia]AXK89723.1 glyoxalase [Nocardia farcinica]MBA4856735.1 VOC family protein [Nocardia farcinica]MBC9818879.1 VOC family protein [Nocardia farcinica]MBF6072852.1 VOC family protein [Nocardia farcinica]MBF6141513.1 VOC family protein [Nocardia farcinica]
MDWKIELVAIPVTDVDRAKEFYTRIGFHADHDQSPTPDIRFVQLTPPGSACSICIGRGITEATPGSVEGVQMVVDSAEEAYRRLRAAGVDATPVEDMGWGLFTFFSDPDGNKWAVQQLPKYD